MSGTELLPNNGMAVIIRASAATLVGNYVNYDSIGHRLVNIDDLSEYEINSKLTIYKFQHMHL